MAPFTPDNATDRIWIDYTSCLEPHSLLLRVEGPLTSAAAQAIAQDVIDELLGVMDDSDSVLGARHSQTDQEYALPLEVTGGAGALTTTTINTENKASYVQFIARGNDGRKVSYRVFSAAAADFTVYRTPVSGMSTPWQDLYTALSGISGIVNISGASLIWQTYANIGHSGYYQRRLR